MARTTKDILGRTKAYKKRKTHNLLFSLISLVIGLAFGAGLVLTINAYSRFNVDFELVGSEQVNLLTGQSYTEEGYTAKLNSSNKASSVTYSYYDANFNSMNEIDYYETGTYYIGYTLEVKSYINTIYRKIVIADKAPTDDIAVHFLELGNKYAGDCIYIKAGETDILIDAGSRQSSATTIINYVDNYCTDGILEYVVATHAHQDHIAAFASTASTEGIFAHYECKTIIDFARTNASSTTYNNYITARDNEVSLGATHYTALDCYKEISGAKKSYTLAEDITMEILYNYYYDHDTTDENNYSVCLLISAGNRKFLLTGDLESSGESYLAYYNDLPVIDLFKANHHGSYTANTTELLSIIKPKNVVITAVAGSSEYTSTNANQFPAQAAIDIIGKYTTNVYCTTLCTDYAAGAFESMNGNIVATSTQGQKVMISCSNNNTILKNTAWSLANRTWPELIVTNE